MAARQKIFSSGNGNGESKGQTRCRSVKFRFYACGFHNKGSLFCSNSEKTVFLRNSQNRVKRMQSILTTFLVEFDVSLRYPRPAPSALTAPSTGLWRTINSDPFTRHGGLSTRQMMSHMCLRHIS